MTSSFATFADPQMLKLPRAKRRESARGERGTRKLDAAVAFHEQKVRPDLLQSQIVPVLLAIGEKLPFIGRPATLPTR